MSGEFELIQKLIADWKADETVIVGPGDDASAFSLQAGNDLILQSTDLLVENVHFRKDWGTPYQLGWKSVAVNLSDIAAMGGTPLHTHLSLAIPPSWQEDEILSLMLGYRFLSEKYGVGLIGGDLSRSPEHMVISVTITGKVKADQVIRRSGAQDNDIIWISGEPGYTGHALYTLETKGYNPKQKKLIDLFLMPHPEIELGQFCATSGSVTAMIDVSDGIAGDLGHILGASKKGAVILQHQLPLTPDFGKKLISLNFDPVQFVLNSGEEYFLLGCTPQDKFEAFADKVEQRLSRQINPIGYITSEPGIKLLVKGGTFTDIQPQAFDHFK